VRREAKPIIVNSELRLRRMSSFDKLRTGFETEGREIPRAEQLKVRYWGFLPALRVEMTCPSSYKSLTIHNSSFTIYNSSPQIFPQSPLIFP
jgi:hypothetical protein